VTALAKLKERRAAASAQLAALGAAKDAVQFGETVSVPEKRDRQRQMERMIVQRLRAEGKKPAKAKDAPPAMVAFMLLAVDVGRNVREMRQQASQR